MILLLPCTAFAATNCRVIEFPDHYEAICDGTAEKTPASSQIAGQEQIVASARTTEESEQMEVPPEMIVRNGLARLYGDAWLKSRQGQ